MDFLLPAFFTLLLVILFCSSLLFAMILFLSRDTTKIPEIVTRLTNLETMTQGLVEDVSLEVNAPKQFWRTQDGKYSGGSFEELLNNMASDPDGPLTQEEIDVIKSIFNKISGENPDTESGEWNKE